ncbi:MAG: hypothetical protein OXC91_12540, partial [Rhodobacteraceae bacterium]|nr:hypothetical protein [Paracoccaceae bacterium]
MTNAKMIDSVQISHYSCKYCKKGVLQCPRDRKGRHAPLMLSLVLASAQSALARIRIGQSYGAVKRRRGGIGCNSEELCMV